ncbi:MAG: tetratricopeptide repeat protein [Candidatus Omnitrophota bacterium]|nr:tetratricopeptide repeat protein [Candidatus Omnitrophota bacterium]
MEKINCIRFARQGLIYFAILFFLPFLNTSYIYAGNADIGVSSEAEQYRTKGYDAQQRGDIDTAIEWYQKAANLRPEYASPHNDLGILFETKGWLDRAEAEYQRALAIDPNYKEVHTNLALLYERKGELEKAAFHWMKRYKLGDSNDQWAQEAKARLEKLGLLDKTEKVDSPKIKQQALVKKPVEKKQKPGSKPKVIKYKKVAPAKRPVEKKQKPEPKPKPKKDSDWTRIGSEKKVGEGLKPSPTKSNKTLDAEIQESLKLAEERLRKEKAGKGNVKETRSAVNNEASVSYNKAKDYYNQGEYAKALDVIRIANQKSKGNKLLSELEEEIKFKMKEARIEDYYKEGMIHYRQRDFAGAKKEFEAMLTILPE